MRIRSRTKMSKMKRRRMRKMRRKRMRKSKRSRRPRETPKKRRLEKPRKSKVRSRLGILPFPRSWKSCRTTQSRSRSRRTCLEPLERQRTAVR